jgi:hypothetical protein
MAEYDLRHAQAFPGMVANSRPGDGVTVLCEDAAGMGFGVPVFQGVKDNGVTTVASAKFVGITPIDVTLVHKGADVDRYKQGENATAKRGGVIWVTNGLAAVVKGDPVYVTPAKAFTNVDGGGANFRAGRSVFDSSGAAGALVRIEINP